MPYETSPLSQLQGANGPRSGFSTTKPELLDGAQRSALGLGATEGTKRKSSLDGSPNGLGKEDFLKLLLAQLSNQDPLRPMEDKEFIAQLAQFNTLEQMQQVNRHLVDMVSSMALSQASTLLGKQIEAGSVSGTVTAVTMTGGQAKLTVGDKQVALSDVTKVLTGAAASATDALTEWNEPEAAGEATSGDAPTAAG